MRLILFSFLLATFNVVFGQGNLLFIKNLKCENLQDPIHYHQHGCDGEQHEHLFSGHRSLPPGGVQANAPSDGYFPPR